MKNLFLSGLMFLALILPAAAGTLDDAPFKIMVPGKNWLLIDSTAQDLGQNASLVASLIQTNSALRSVVIKTTMDGMAAASLKSLLAGIRESLTRPDVQNLAEEDTTFVGLKARRFTYEVTQNGQVMYSDTVVFIEGSSGWTIDCVGPIDQKEEVKKMLTYYQKNTH